MTETADWAPDIIRKGEQCVSYKSYNTIRNCGDAINPYIIQNISHLPPVRPRPGANHLVGIGSVMHLAKENSFVWGTGMLSPIRQAPSTPSGNFRALRGKLSYEALRKVGKNLRDIPLGDPGFLINRLYESNKFALKYKYAVVPHHHSLSHPFFSAIKQRDDTVVVNMVDDTLRPVEQILQSEIILSESLHGLIFAESFGKRSVWIARREDSKWAFKFLDWFSTMAIGQAVPVIYPFDIEEIAKSAVYHEPKIESEALINSLPIQEVLCVNDAERIGFKACRELGVIKVECPASLAMRLIEKESRSEYEITEEDIKQIQKVSMRSVRNRAESNFVFISNEALPDSLISDGIELLEKDTTISHIFFSNCQLGQNAYPAVDRPDSFSQSSNHHSVRAVENSSLSSSILLRPNLLIKKNKKYVTVFYQLKSSS